MKIINNLFFRSPSLSTLTFVVIISLTLLITFSCGQKTKQTIVNFSFKNVISRQTNKEAIELSGGIMIVGHSEEKQQSFSLVLGNANETSSITLANGNWNFEAIGWTGNSVGHKMEGVARCSTEISTQLNGGNTTIELVINQNNCNNSRFGDLNFFDTTLNTFKPLKIVSCGFNTITETVTDTSSCRPGKYSSAQVIIPRMDLFYEGEMDQYQQAWPPFIHKDFISICYTLNNGSASSDIRIPVGTSANDLGFSPMIFPYETDNCDSGIIFNDRPYEIQKGHSLASWSIEGSDNIFVRGSAGSDVNVAFIMERESTQTDIPSNTATITGDSSVFDINQPTILPHFDVTFSIGVKADTKSIKVALSNGLYLCLRNSTSSVFLASGATTLCSTGLMLAGTNITAPSTETMNGVNAYPSIDCSGTPSDVATVSSPPSLSIINGAISPISAFVFSTNFDLAIPEIAPSFSFSLSTPVTTSVGSIKFDFSTGNYLCVNNPSHSPIINIGGNGANLAAGAVLQKDLSVSGNFILSTITLYSVNYCSTPIGSFDVSASAYALNVTDISMTSFAFGNTITTSDITNKVGPAMTLILSGPIGVTINSFQLNFTGSYNICINKSIGSVDSSMSAAAPTTISSSNITTNAIYTLQNITFFNSLDCVGAYNKLLSATGSPSLTVNPSAPFLNPSFTPASNSVTPSISGVVANGSTLQFFDDASCLNSIGNGNATAFNTTGITLSVASSTTTEIYSIITDNLSVTYPCTLTAEYMSNYDPFSNLDHSSIVAQNSNITVASYQTRPTMTIPSGSIILFKTSLGKYGALKVMSYVDDFGMINYHMYFKVKVFNDDGTILYQNTVAPYYYLKGTWTANFDGDTVTDLFSNQQDMSNAQVLFYYNAYLLP